MTTRREETTEKVYQAMLKLQAEQVPRGVPLKAIAKEAGLAHKGTVANHIKHLVEDGLVDDLGGGRGRYWAVPLSEFAARILREASKEARRAAAQRAHEARAMTYSELAALVDVTNEAGE